jgi:hypothetical protein
VIRNGSSVSRHRAGCSGSAGYRGGRKGFTRSRIGRRPGCQSEPSSPSKVT